MAVSTRREESIAGTNNRKSVPEEFAERLLNSLPGRGSNTGGPAFLRNTVGQKTYQNPARAELMNSRYVNDWRDWIDPDGNLRRVDYGLLYFVAECIYTYIEGVPLGEEGVPPIGVMPHPETEPEYFNVLATTMALWQTERFLFIDKSRRLLMSWLLRSCDTWDILFHPGRKLFLMAENQSDGENLIYRNVFQYERIPSDRLSKSALPHPLALRSKTEPGSRERFARFTVCHSDHEPGTMDSFIEAVPKNDDLRSKGASRITIEEAPTIRNLERQLTGLMGTMMGRSRKDGQYEGGQLVLIGTPDALSYAAEIINDRIGNDSIHA